MKWSILILAGLLATLLYVVAPVPAEGAELRGQDQGQGHAHDAPTRQPGADRWESFRRVFSLRDYNTRVVVAGTTMLGAASGLIGTFMLLRKRALVSDAISHATLPGIAAAFIVMTWLGGDGKNLAVLLVAAMISAVLGVASVLVIRSATRIKEDAALGIVLSVYFGLGVALLGVIQKMATGNAAGLESFIYGKTASMLWMDAVVIGIVGVAAVLVCLLMLKEFAIVCFDQQYAQTLGWPVTVLDVAMMALVVIVTVVGLQAVGLILVVAMLIIPAATARFWSERLVTLLVLAAIVGAFSGLFGAMISALYSNLPSGAIIVIVASTLFLFSLLFGIRRGALWRALEHRRLQWRVEQQHLLRALFEWCEQHGADAPMPWSRLAEARSWPVARLRRTLRSAARRGWVREGVGARDRWQLTERGIREASRVTRNHRLWELFLITHADIAPSHVDRDADMVEHVLGRELVDRLEALVADDRSRPPVPPSPHAMKAAP